MTPPDHNYNGTYNPRTRERGLDCQQEEKMKRRGRPGTDGDRGNLPKIRNKFIKLPHGGGNTGRTTPKISLGGSIKKDNTDREHLARP